LVATISLPKEKAQEPIATKIIETKIAEAIPAIPKEPTRPKTTLNLGNILKPTAKSIEVEEESKLAPAIDRPLDAEELKQAWNQYAELRKDQVAEYYLLKRGFELKGTELTISLSNSIEEPLLAGMKINLVTYLREQLKNSSIQVNSILKEISKTRMAYTNKEKFESLAERNPLLSVLKEKFGLDPDF
jgi:DNA polymerase III subunit gamma/tau